MVRIVESAEVIRVPIFDKVKCLFAEENCRKECSIFEVVKCIRSKPVTEDGQDIITVARRSFTPEEQSLKCLSLSTKTSISL